MTASGFFALNIPSRGQAQLTLDVGNVSAKTNPQKLPEHSVRTFTPDGCAVPLVQGCIGWLVCKVLPEPRNHEVYDLFIGEVTHAFADTRVYQNGHWQFDQAPDDLRTLHYVAGGQFFVIGESLNLAK